MLGKELLKEFDMRLLELQNLIQKKRKSIEDQKRNIFQLKEKSKTIETKLLETLKETDTKH